MISEGAEQSGAAENWRGPGEGDYFLSTARTDFLFFSSAARAVCQQLLVLVSTKRAIVRFYPFLCTANVEECLKIRMFLFFFILDVKVRTRVQLEMTLSTAWLYSVLGYRGEMIHNRTGFFFITSGLFIRAILFFLTWF